MASRRRGWIITPDGQSHELPEVVLDQEVLSWPLGLDEVEPGRRVRFLKEGDLYRRHEIVRDTAYVWMKPSPARQVTPDEIERLTGVKPE
jgi:hypothetical protein